jgi:hypothetical protein
LHPPRSWRYAGAGPVLCLVKQWCPDFPPGRWLSAPTMARDGHRTVVSWPQRKRPGVGVTPGPCVFGKEGPVSQDRKTRLNAIGKGLIETGKHARSRDHHCYLIYTYAERAVL